MSARIVRQPSERTLDLWLGVRRGRGPRIVIRFGRPRWRQFSERFQGTHGIPVRWTYHFGGHLSVLRNEPSG